MYICSFVVLVAMAENSIASTKTTEPKGLNMSSEHAIDIETESESDSQSTLSNFEILSEPEDDMEVDPERGNFDFSVPDIKAHPPKWTDDIHNFTVPPFLFTGGPTLPDSFSNSSTPSNYFKLFSTDTVIDNIVRFTNEYAQIQIAKKRITNPNYTDKEWASDGSDNVHRKEMRANPNPNPNPNPYPNPNIQPHH